jgi:hypothetical protein
VFLHDLILNEYFALVSGILNVISFWRYSFRILYANWVIMNSGHNLLRALHFSIYYRYLFVSKKQVFTFHICEVA